MVVVEGFRVVCCVFILFPFLLSKSASFEMENFNQASGVETFLLFEMTVDDLCLVNSLGKCECKATVTDFILLVSLVLFLSTGFWIQKQILLLPFSTCLSLSNLPFWVSLTSSVKWEYCYFVKVVMKTRQDCDRWWVLYKIAMTSLALFVFTF